MARQLPVRQVGCMTARMATGPVTRIFLIERFDQLAHRIQDALNQIGGRVGFERASNVVIAARDLAYIDPDMVVVNVDEMEPGEWDTLAQMREAHPHLRFCGLSGSPSTKEAVSEAHDACDDFFPLVCSLDDLKSELSGPRPHGN